MRVVVGRVGRPHGIRGDVTVEPRTDDPAGRYAPGARLFTAAEGAESLEVVDHRWHSGRLLVRFAGVSGREEAEAVRGTVLYAEAATAVEDDAWYDHELIGLAVRVGGIGIGEVSDVVHLPAQDLLEVSLDGDKRLVPLVAEIVPVVDVAGGYVEVEDVPGLLAEPEE